MEDSPYYMRCVDKNTADTEGMFEDTGYKA